MFSLNNKSSSQLPLSGLFAIVTNILIHWLKLKHDKRKFTQILHFDSRFYHHHQAVTIIVMILCTSIQIPPATLILNHRPKSCLKNERFLIFQISPNSRLSERKITNDMLPLQIAHQILTHRHWGIFCRASKLCELIFHEGGGRGKWLREIK